MELTYDGPAKINFIVPLQPLFYCSVISQFYKIVYKYQNFTNLKFDYVSLIA